MTGDALETDVIAWNRALCKRSWRSITGAVLWLLVLTSAVLGMVALDAAADALLVSGMRVVGHVVGVEDPRRGTPTITVGYTVGVTPRQAVVNRDSGLAYHVGDLVWLYYDPIDPRHVRTLEERNHSDAWKWGLISPALVALGLCPWCTVYAVRWVRRCRAARRTHWIPATLIAVNPVDAHQRLVLKCRGNGRQGVRTLAMVPGRYAFLQRLEHNQAWVGGEGTATVLMLACGTRPCPILVRPTSGSVR
ncbi:DUF3592 domain-containing protein [Amycolatopsis sp. NPDC051372]|uniref:DUF3592 domain-containing protein n=1 Tax=Amycolatopsis sp. NPDC051372 TaxID=3155669 RepID=UPI0034427AB3